MKHLWDAEELAGRAFRLFVWIGFAAAIGLGSVLWLYQQGSKDREALSVGCPQQGEGGR